MPAAVRPAAVFKSSASLSTVTAPAPALKAHWQAIAAVIT